MHFQVSEIQIFRARTIKINVRYQIVNDFDNNQKNQNEFIKELIEQKCRR